ncbi:hypothetical protein OG585_02035 [Streptomyces sp. NBC_01340]|uniref:hypothetical protein n=1 Tax=unclassified Streptomyces TaxID=2593676 RepID=UPI00224ED178|nr:MULTISPECIES: hypothetical protein [unclassified Streptomyces]MCX4461931.1 hypothetical protein [Streptomyces sp. NBC_01719]MCX4490839.1 hypothetical protein [Streptomyces sp. NBC_01728]MCX4594579.1 hypothetical protein [Streptomyces sp. NBC_01549]WSI36181.1 hypothetical protein OG585_02035 [Streptomyces sp. NBC_01340]
MLRLGAAVHRAVVRVNEVWVAERESGRTSFEADITGVVEPGGVAVIHRAAFSVRRRRKDLSPVRSGTDHAVRRRGCAG